MRRDMDLIRELLLKLEAMPLRAGAQHFIDYSDEMFVIEDYSLDDVVYHLKLILEAGFTDPPDNQGMSSFTYSGLYPDSLSTRKGSCQATVNGFLFWHDSWRLPDQR